MRNEQIIGSTYTTRLRAMTLALVVGALLMAVKFLAYYGLSSDSLRRPRVYY